MNFLSAFLIGLIGIAFAGWFAFQVALLTLDDSSVELLCSGKMTAQFCE